MSTEKFNMILKLYPEEIELSKKKRPLWIHKSEGNKIPLHIRRGIGQSGEFLATSNYLFDHDGWVINLITNEKVVRNFRTAGKPNMESINGQSIWNGNVARHTRNKLKHFLTDYFVPNIVRQLPKTLYPSGDKSIHFEFIFFRKMINVSLLQDIDNHSMPYVKAFMDALELLNVIPSDSPTWVRGIYSRYQHIPDDSERRLEIKIHFCDANQKLD